MKLLLWGRGSECRAALAGLLFMITFCLDINKKLFFFFSKGRKHTTSPSNLHEGFQQPVRVLSRTLLL